MLTSNTSNVTIVLLVSRSFLLDDLFSGLARLDCDRTQTNLFVLVDGDINLYLKVRKLIDMVTFNNKLVVRAPHVERRSPSQQFRRSRIAYLHNLAKQYLNPCDYILTLEDDGLFPSNGLTKLLKSYKRRPNAGFIQGLEVGRWQSRYIGAWNVDNPADPTSIESITYKKGLLSIDAGGLYFCLTKYEHYIDHEFKPTNNFGPDITFGLALRNKGLKNYIDTSIVLDHHNESGRIFNLKDTIKTVSMRKSRGIWRSVWRVQT